MLAEVTEQPAEDAVLGVAAASTERLEVNPLLAGTIATVIKKGVGRWQAEVSREEDRGEYECPKSNELVHTAT